MAWYVWANLVGALVLAVMGSAAVIRGWSVPWLSSRVLRPRMRGVAMLCVAAALAVGGLGLSGANDRWQWLPLVGGPLLLAGAALLLLSSAPPRVQARDSGQ